MIYLLLARICDNPPIRRELLGRRERISEPHFDVSLPAHANSLCFPVDCMKQIDREIDIYALNFTTWASSFGEVEMSTQVFAGVVILIETSYG